MKLPSPIASFFIQDRKKRPAGKVSRLGELQISVDCGEVPIYCSVAPLSPIAEEVVPTPMHDTTPVEPLARPASPVLRLQNRKHILSIGGGDIESALSVVTEMAIWLPVWSESHDEDVNSSDRSVTDISDFFYHNFNVFGKG